MSYLDEEINELAMDLCSSPTFNSFDKQIVTRWLNDLSRYSDGEHEIMLSKYKENIFGIHSIFDLFSCIKGMCKKDGKQIVAHKITDHLVLVVRNLNKLQEDNY